VSGPAAVLIDLDGTLVDTVAVWHAAYLRLADELGVTAPDDLWPRVAGRSMRASLAVYGDAVAGHDPDALVARLVDLAAAGLGRPEGPAAGWSWLPGARELLTMLRGADGPRPVTALVTSAWRAFTLPLLAAALGEDAGATFDALVCGDDVAEGKPAPESHLRAARLLDVRPEDCLVIEDSPTGVAAAEAAGMVVLVVPHAGRVAPAPGRAVRKTLAGLTLTDLAALHARLRSGAVD
jgi:HAD superfamily hydrolase (TIGR01509 family)